MEHVSLRLVGERSDLVPGFRNLIADQSAAALPAIGIREIHECGACRKSGDRNLSTIHKILLQRKSTPPSSRSWNPSCSSRQYETTTQAISRSIRLFGEAGAAARAGAQSDVGQAGGIHRHSAG